MTQEESQLITPGKWFADFDENSNALETYYDESFRKLLGYETEEEFGNDQESWSSHVHPDDVERVDAYFADIMEKHPEGKDYDIEYRILTKWGYHWFHDYAKISRSKDGSVLHFEGVSFDIQHIKDYEMRQKHDALKKEILDYIVNRDDDPIDMLGQFAEKIRVLLDCDQVIYRDLEDTRVMVNSSGIEKQWSVPESYCRQCPHFNAHHPMYKDGYTEMENCQEGWKGIPVYEKCPIKSSLTRIVYCNGEVAGYLAIHYVQKYHKFTEVERTTVEEFVRNFSLILSRYEARKESSKLRKKEEEQHRKNVAALTENNQRVMALEDNLESLYDVELESGKYIGYVKGEFYQSNVADKLLEPGDYFEDLRGNIDAVIYPEDRDGLFNVLNRESLKKALSETDRIEYFYRMFVEGTVMWFKIRVVYKDAEKKNVIIGCFNAVEEMAEKEQLELTEKRNKEFIDSYSKQYSAVYYGNLEDGSYQILVRKENVVSIISGTDTICDAIRTFAEKTVHPSDIGLFSKDFYSLEDIKAKIGTGESYTFEYRSNNYGDYRWFRADFRRINEEDILVGFKDCDDEMIEKQSIDILLNEFDALYRVYLDKNEIQTVRSSRVSRAGAFEGKKEYSSTVAKFAETVDPKSYKDWMNFSDPAYMKRYMATENHREFTYVLPDTKQTLRRFTIDVIERNNGEASVLLFSFTGIDDITANAIRMQNQIAEQNIFTNYFLQPYRSAYYIDLNTHNAQVYKSLDNPSLAHTVMPDFFAVVREHAQESASPEDMDELVRIFSSETIRKLMDTAPVFRHTFKDIGEGGDTYFQLEIVRGADNDHVALGFKDISKEIKEQREHLLGAIPVSPDILSKENIGMWAFELDEGQPPRMYDDDTMLGLVGLDHQVPPEEAYHAWYDHIDPASYDLVADAVAKMASGEHAEVQYPWHHPDGRTFIVRCGGVRNWEYTKGIRIEGTHQDVTETLHFDEEQNRLIRTLAEQQRHIKSFGDMINAALWSLTVKDDQTASVEWSDEFRHMLGFENEEDFPNTADALQDRIHPDDLERTLAHFQNAIRDRSEGFVYDVQYRVMRKNGEYCWYHAVGKFENDTDDTRTLYGIITDISANKMLEMQHALSDGLAREYHTVWLVDGFGDHRLHLYRSTGKKTVRSAVQRGLDEPTYDGTMVKYVMTSVHEDDRERVLEATRFETVARETPDTGTYVVSYKRYYDDKGNTDYHQMCFAKAVADDGTVNFILAFRDADQMLREQIAQQQQLQEALSMAQSASRAKTTFLNNMSHDIRTPMNAIIGYTGLAASHIDNKEQVSDYLGKISQSSDHLLSLINDVLDMSRIESGKMNLEEKDENLSDIIHTLRDIIQADIHSKQHDLFIDTVNVNDEHIICDKLRLNQVLLNILSNAIKYTAAGGTISMRITEKTVKKSGYATYEFCVKDNGMGMDKEFIDTLFDPFTRVKSSTVSGIQGTGLGMAITKNIIDMMGGKIDVKSELGKGTEVIVTFDFKLANAPSEDFTIPELSGVKGLVADDDANTCLSIAKMLKDVGMRSEWCTSGKEAVIRAQAAYHDGDLFKVYIIDWLMPDMNGIETTRRIRKVIGDDIPIIILTAYDWSDIEDEAREAGVTGFVSKPMFPSDLHRVLKKCIGMEETEGIKTDATLDLTGKKILLVEDNELNREIASAVLEEYGCEVFHADDGSVAVDLMKKAKSGDYDLVLMDVQMPVMDGYEATRQIRGLGTEVSNIPILAMTANAFEEDRRDALEAGMNDHIAKPFDIETLKEVLAKYLL